MTGAVPANVGYAPIWTQEPPLVNAGKQETLNDGNDNGGSANDDSDSDQRGD
jgi:hypothetical protein